MNVSTLRRSKLGRNLISLWFPLPLNWVFCSNSFVLLSNNQQTFQTFTRLPKYLEKTCHQMPTGNVATHMYTCLPEFHATTFCCVFDSGIRSADPWVSTDCVFLHLIVSVVLLVLPWGNTVSHDVPPLRHPARRLPTHFDTQKHNCHTCRQHTPLAR